MPRESSYLHNVIHLKSWMVLWDSNMYISALGALYFAFMAGNLNADVAQKIIILLVSLGSALICGALINDYCDINEDRMAGKKRTIYFIPRSHIIMYILVFFFISQFVTWVIIGDMFYISAYIIWYFFGVFYSAPPLRFKARGAAGVLSNALIEKLFPIILAMIVFQFYGWESIPLLLFSIVVQVEIIAHHQILDYEADLKTGVKTYAASKGLSSTSRILRYFRPLVLLFGVSVILVLSTKIETGLFFAMMVLFGYIVSRGIVKSEDSSIPYSISYLSIVLYGITPLYLAVIGTLHTLSFAPILIFVAIIQYPMAKKYFGGLKSLAKVIRK